MSKSGFPDVIVVKDSISFYFEIKTEKDKLSKLQEITINKLNKCKKIAYVISSLEEFKQIIGE